MGCVQQAFVYEVDAEAQPLWDQLSTDLLSTCKSLSLLWLTGCHVLLWVRCLHVVQKLINALSVQPVAVQQNMCLEVLVKPST